MIVQPKRDTLEIFERLGTLIEPDKVRKELAELAYPSLKPTDSWLARSHDSQYAEEEKK